MKRDEALRTPAAGILFALRHGMVTLLNHVHPGSRLREPALARIESAAAAVRALVGSRLAVLVRRWGRMAIPRRIAYPAIGLTATVACLAGLLVVRLTPAGLSWANVRGEVLGDLATYLYLLIAAASVFAGLGAALGYQTDRLLTISATDALTGLDNRRAFEQRLDEEIPRSERGGQPLSLLLVDLDKFKEVNDRCGHVTGDAVLSGVGHAIQHTLRRTDRGARVGGDEFVILAPDTGTQAASVLAERLREAIASEARRLRQPVTASIGISTFDPHAAKSADRLALINGADLALYAAKRGGRNGVKVAPHPRRGGQVTWRRDARVSEQRLPRTSAT